MVLFVRIGARTFRRTEKMKITPAIKNKVLQLRGEGTSYGNIAKATKISKASVINIIKARQQQSEVTEGAIRQSNENPLLPRGTVEGKFSAMHQSEINHDLFWRTREYREVRSKTGDELSKR